MRIFQQRDPGVGNSQWSAQHEGADGVGGNDNWDEREKRVVNKSAGINRELVEAKEEGD